MPIWRLEPINPDDHHWRASTYSGPLSVRAAEEDKARKLAASQFRIDAEKHLGAEVPRAPWLYSWLVNCTRIETSDPFVRGLKSLQTNPLGDAAGPSH